MWRVRVVYIELPQQLLIVRRGRLARIICRLRVSKIE